MDIILTGRDGVIIRRVAKENEISARTDMEIVHAPDVITMEDPCGR